MTSRRELYAAGEPFGDCATRRVAGRVIYGGGDSSSAPAPTQQTVTQTNVPDYARPYVEDMLGRTQALTDTNQNPYQSYGGSRVAGPTGMQQQAYGAAANMQVAPQIGQATGMAGNVFNTAAGVGRYDPQTGFNPGNAPANVNAMTVHSMPGYERTGTNQWSAGARDQYMDPYMQSVVDIEKREAARQSQMQGQTNNATAVANGAFGGTRDALVESERQRNLGQQLGDIQAKGSDAAYSQALNAFNSDQSRSLQSQMANQGAGLTWGGQYLQGQMANQGANLSAQQANQNAGLQYNNQYLNAQQLGEQSRQFGAGLGMQGLQAQLGAAGLMGTLGQNQYNQQVGIAGLQDQFGREQQLTNQQGLDAQYQNWVNQQMYPYRQLEFENNLVHGNYSPNTTSSVYGGYGSPASQIAGIGTAAYGMSKMMAEGGIAETEPATYESYEPLRYDKKKKQYEGEQWYVGTTPFQQENVYAGPGKPGKRMNADEDPRSLTKKKYANGGAIDVDAREVPEDAGLAHLLISQIN